MKKVMILSIIFCLTWLFAGNEIIAGGSSPEPVSRAISLKVLQQKLKNLHGTGSVPASLYHFCGINRIDGYVVDEVNSDIILIGRVFKDLPPLYLDDFVVALRNTWIKYAELKGNTNYYSNPGCSIDPDPNVMKRLENVTNHDMNTDKDDEIEQSLEKWEKICRSPQTVKVFGVPFDTRFASIMIKADYDMKRLTDGSDELNLIWFSSFMEMGMEQMKDRIKKGKSIGDNGFTMNRFWFYPGKNLYLEDEQGVIIKRCEVKLLTEEEYTTEKGTIAGRGRADPLANEFVKEFSSSYNQIAAQRPIYYELENLFRFVALAKIMKLKTPHEKVGLNIDYLLEQYPVSKVKVERYVSGVSNVRRYRTHKGDNEGYRLWLPSCGGVSMEFDPKPQNFKQDQTSAIKNLQKDALKERASSQQLSWDIDKGRGATDNPVRQDNKYYTVVLLDTLGAYLNGHVAVLLGNQDVGYNYYSKSKNMGDTVKDFYKTMNDFKSSVSRYNLAYQVEVSRKQYEKMKSTSEKILGYYYHITINNCADFVHFVLKSGNLNPGDRNILRPNSYFKDVTNKNPGKRLW